MKLNSKLYNTVGASTLVLGLFVNGANAADFEPVVAGPNWDRYYFGGNIGANMGYAEDLDSDDFRGHKQDFAAGLQFGRNWNTGNVVWGVEADIGMGGLGWHGATGDHAASVSLLSSLRGRLGLPFGNSLAYVTAGAGMIFGEAFSTVTSTPNNGSSWDVRPVVGLGVESMVTPSMSIKAEGLAFIGDYKVNNGIRNTDDDASLTQFETVGVLRLGVNFLFGAPGTAEVMPEFQPNWSRFYMGGNIGGNIAFAHDYSSGDFSRTEQALSAGLQIGANFDQGAFVWGVEADVNNGGLNWDQGTGDHQIDLLVVSSLRGRVGVAIDNHLIYATAGAGMMWASAEDSSTEYSGDDFWVRPVVGIGVESMITESISLKAEGLAWIGEDRIKWHQTACTGCSYGKMDTMGTFRLGINFHL